MDADETRQLLRITCADALALLTDHLDGALQPGDAARVREHLDGCEACELYLDQLQATIRVVGDLRADETYGVEASTVDALAAAFRRARC